VNIIDAIRDPKVFGPHFAADTWAAWLTFLAALFGLPMSDEQFAIYQKHTGRSAGFARPKVGTPVLERGQEDGDYREDERFAAASTDH